jgi:CBS domain containing-hemolysin-like protein
MAAEMLFELSALTGLLALSGLFSGSETALVALSMARVEALVQERRAGAAALYELKRDPSRMLTAILIGNNLVNIGASAMATVIATREFGHAGPGIAVGLLTFFILVFGEITPKSLATRYPEKISLLAAVPLLGFMRLTYPLLWMFGRFTTWVHKAVGGKGEPVVTESELIGMLGHGVAEGEIEDGEREIIERVFAFNDLKVRDVMTPKSQLFSLDATLSVAEALPLIVAQPFSRIPVYEESPDDIVKVVYLRDLLQALSEGQHEVSLKAIAHQPLFVAQYQSLDELFETFRRRNRHFSVVVDEYGEVRGIATLEDLLEEIVGEIYDESDRSAPTVDQFPEDEIVVEGGTELRVVSAHFGIQMPGKPTDTVSLWILKKIKVIPTAGESFTQDGLEVSIREASSRMIGQVHIRRLSGPTIESAETTDADGRSTE